MVQAYKGEVPIWLTQCINSVRQWAEKLDFEYIFIADSQSADVNGFYTPLAGLVPDWFAAKSTVYPHPIFDLARIELASSLHEKYERVVWFDADVLVFLPKKLLLPSITDAAFTREFWTLWHQGTELTKQRVTNCVCVYLRNSVTMHHYRQTCLELAWRSPAPLAKSAMGTDLLTQLHARTPLCLLPNIANLSPHVLRAIAGRDMRRLTTFRARSHEPLYAANLCASHEERNYLGVYNSRGDYLRAVRALLDEPTLLSG